MQMIDLDTFSAERMNKFVDILTEIHRAKVLNHDPCPRNMMVVHRDGERIPWIDFDRAQTYSEELTPRQQKRFDHEVELVDYFAKALVSGTTLRQPATWIILIYLFGCKPKIIIKVNSGRHDITISTEMGPDLCDRIFGPSFGYY